MFFKYLANMFWLLRLVNVPIYQFFNYKVICVVKTKKLLNIYKKNTILILH